MLHLNSLVMLIYARRYFFVGEESDIWFTPHGTLIHQAAQKSLLWLIVRCHGSIQNPEKQHLLSRTLDGRHTLTGPSAAGMLLSSVQGGIHSVSLQGMSAI
jgi:hypothetical protein